MSSIWPILHYDDTNASLRFLVEVFGFQGVLVVPDQEGEVVHAELRWPGGGSVVHPPSKMQFGSGVDTYAFTAGVPEGNLWTFGTYQGTR